MKAPRLMLLFALLAAAPVVIAQNPKDLAAEAKIRKVLGRIVIPKLEFHEATLQEALDFLNNEIRRPDPHGRGIPILLETRERFGPAAPPDSSGHSEADTGDPLTNAKDAKITVTLTNISIAQALLYVSGLSNTKASIRTDGIHIVDWWEPEPMFTRDFRIPLDFFPAYAKEDRLDHTDTTARIKNDFRGYLEENGVKLPPGAEATLNDAATRLTVHTTTDQFEPIRQVLQTERPPAAFPVPGPEVPKFIQGSPKTGTSDWRNAETDPAKKMRTIMLPRVTLEKINLFRAVKILSEMGTRYDHQSRRSRRGVPIKAVFYTESSDAYDPPMVSYAATNVPLFEAVQAVARRCQRYIRMDGKIVWLDYRHGTPFTLTRTYLLPPTPAAQMAKWPEFINQDIPVPWLRDSGVNLLSNGNATYIAKRHCLIVTDTDATQQGIQVQNEQAWRDYYTAEKAKKDRAR